MSELFTSNLHSNLIPTKVASEISGYNADYLARLCREKKIEGTQVGRSWLIDRTSLEAFVQSQEEKKRERAEELRTQREKEYRRAQQPVAKAAASAKKVLIESPLSKEFSRELARGGSVTIPVLRAHPPARARQQAAPAQYSRPLAAAAVALAVVAGSAYASTSDEFLAAVTAAPMHAVDLALALNPSTSFVRASSFRVTDARDAQSAHAPQLAIPSARELSRTVALAGAASTQSITAVHDLTDAAREPFGTTVAARTARERIAVAASVARDPLGSAIYAYVMSGAYLYSAGASAGDAYLATIERAGSDALAAAASTRDAIAFAPRATTALLGTYAHGVYAWNDAAPKAAGTVVMALYDTGDATINVAGRAPLAVRAANEQLANGAFTAPRTLAQAAATAQAAAFAPFSSSSRTTLSASANNAYLGVLGKIAARTGNTYGHAVALGGSVLSVPVKAENTLLGIAGYTASLLDGAEPVAPRAGPDVATAHAQLAQASATSSSSTLSRLPASVISIAPISWQRAFAHLFNAGSDIARIAFTSGLRSFATLLPGGTVSTPALTIVNTAPVETLALPSPAGVTRPVGTGAQDVGANGAGTTIVRNIVNNYYPQTIVSGAMDEVVLAIVRPFVRDSIDAALKNSGGGTTIVTSGGGGNVNSDGATLTNVTISSGTADLSAITTGTLTVTGTTTLATTTVNGDLAVNGTLTTSNFGLGGDTFTSLLGTGLVNNNGVLSISTSTLGSISNSFVQGGNSFGAEAVLGTIDSNPLTFITNNAMAGTFLGNGYFGLGTSSPSERLTVNGNALVSGSVTAATLTSTGTTSVGSLAIGSLTGFLKATAGAVSTGLIDLSTDVTSTLPVSKGGTGSSTLTGILVGNGASPLASLLVSAPLSFSGTTLSIQQVSATTDGYLSSSDWNTFNTKFATSSTNYWLTTKTTSDIAEGSNLYYTQGRFDTAFAGKTTSDLAEGVNQYFTDARARAALSIAGAGLSYDSGTGVLTVASGYTIPLTASTTEWASAYANRITSASAPLSIVNNTISITQANASTNGYLSSADWNLFNNKISSTSLSAGTGISYNSSTGVISNTGVLSFNGRTGSVVPASGDYTTAQVTENGNLYYTDARAQAAISVAGLPLTYSAGVIGINQANTSQAGYLSAADWNLFNNKISSTSLSAGSGISYNNTTGVISNTGVLSFNGRAGAVSPTSGDYTTSIVAEGTNLYYTDARARAAISVSGSGLAYNTGTGVFSVAGGYTIPLTASTTDWNTAYVNRITSASAPLSISGNVISITQANSSTNGYLSSTDWNTFNNKISSSSLSGASVISYNSATGVITTAPGTFGGSGTYSFPGDLGLYNTMVTGYNSGGSANDALKFVSSNLGASIGVQNNNASGYAGIEYIGNDGNVKVFTGYNNGNPGEFRFNNIATGGNIHFKIAGTDALAINNNRSITIGTLGTGLVKSTGGTLGNAVSGTDYAPATSGSNILYGDGNGGFAGVTVGAPLTFTGGTLSITQSNSTTNGYLSSTDWNTFNTKFATTSTDYWLTTKSTSNLAEGANKYYTDARVGAYISSSSTIPHIGGSAYGDTLSWNGSGWVARATSTLGINLGDMTGVLAQAKGGTGISAYNPGDILYADLGGNLQTLPVGAAGQVLKVQGGLPSWGVDQTIGGGGSDGVFATSSGKIYPIDTSDVLLVGTNATSSNGTLFEVNGASYFSGNVGIGSTSPSAKLSVTGNAHISGNVFAGGSGTFGSLSTGALSASSLTLGSFSGLLYGNSGAVSAASVSGPLSFTGGTLSITQANSTTDGYLSASDWNTFNNKQGALTFTYPLVNAGNTVSLAFGTTTSNTWAGTQTFTNAPVLGSLTGIIYGNSGTLGSVTVASPLTWNAGTLGLATTSFSGSGSNFNADFLDGLDSTYFLANSFGTTSANYWLTTKSTSNLAEGTNLYFTNARARSALSVSGNGLAYDNTSGTFSVASGYTIPLTASTTEWASAYANRITSASAPLSIVNNTISITQANASTNGYLSSADWNLFNNKISSTSLSAGTGISYNSLTGVISNTGVTSNVAGSGISVSGGTGAVTITNTGVLSLKQAFGSAQTGALTLASSTVGTDFSITNTSGTFTFNLPSASAANRGLLTATDWSAFNSKQAALTFTYPLQNSGNVISLAFGTTTNNTWAGTQTFTNAPKLGSLTGVLYGNSGTLAAQATSTAALSAEFGYTGTLGSFVGGTSGTLSLATNGIALSKLVQAGANTILGNPTGAAGNVQAIATSSLGIALSDTTGTLAVSRGGTGSTTLTGLLKGNGTSGVLTAVSGVDYAPATSGNALLYGNGAGGFLGASVTAPLQFSSGTLSMTQANTSVNGYLSAADWNTFNNKVSSTSLSAGSGISYNSSTGVISNTGVLSFNTRTGAVTLSSSDVTTALGYTPFGGTNPLPIANGGTNTTSQATNGVAYFDGTKLAGTSALTFDAASYQLAIPGSGYLSSILFGGYSSVGALKSGAGFFMGTGVQPSTTTNNALVKTSTDLASFFYTRYDRGLEFHTGISGAIGSSFADTQNLRMSIDNSGNVYIAALGNGLVKSTSGVLGNAVSGTDYAPATSGTSILAGNNAGGFAAVSVSAPLSFSSNTLSITQSNSTTNGYLSSTDWNTFNNKVSSTSLSAAYPLQYNSATGAFALAFGTTTSNTWAGTQTFTNVAINGGIYDNSATRGVSGQVLMSTGTGVQWTATSSLGYPGGTVTSVDASGGTTGLSFTGGPITSSGTLTLGGTLGIGNGGTNATSQTTNGIAYYTGTKITTGSGLTYNGTDVTLTGGTFNASQFLANDSSSAPGFSWASDNTTGIYHEANNVIGFSTGGVPRAYIDGNGYFGIGSSTPSAALSVAGDALISGKLTVGGAVTLANVASGLVKSTGGVLSAATAGTDYQAPLGFTYPLQNSGNVISLAFGTTTSNTWAGMQTFTNAPVLGSLTGLVGANNGVLYQISTSTDFVTKATAGTGIFVSANTGAITITNTGVISIRQAYGTTASGALTLASTTSGTDFSITNTGGTFNFNLPSASASARGLLTAADWTTFNGKQAALTFSYPLVNTSNTVSLAFGTTTANAWSSLQTFNGGITTSGTVTLGSLNGILYGNSGVVAAASVSSPLSFTGGTLSISQANGSTNGYLSSADWTLFNNKISSSSLSGGSGISYNSSTGVIGNTGVTSNVAGTGISVSGATGAVTITNTGVLSFNGRTGAVVPTSGDYTTSLVAEGSNLYFTNARAQAAISVAGLPLTYSAGVIGINQANTSQAGYLSSTDWNTFNNKQAALTGTTGQFPYFSGTNTVTATSSLFMAANGNVGVGTTSPYAKLSVAGDLALTGGIYDKNATRGTNGQVLQTTGTGVQWVSTSTLGFASASGSTGQVAYFNGTGTLTGSTGFTFDGTNLTVNGNVTGTQFIGNGGGAGDSGTPSFTFPGDTTTGIYHEANNVIGFSTGGVPRAYIDGNGYFGIGTSSASQALSVQGNALISGSLNVQSATIGSLTGLLFQGSSGVVAATVSSPLSLSAIGTLSITQAGVTTNGYLSSADWTLFNNKISSSSLSGGSGISYNSSTGVIGNTGVTSNVAGTGISVSGATGAVTITNTGVLSLAQTYGSAQTGAITIASSTSGTDFSITNAGGTFTFNLPSASASNRGLLTAADWSTFNSKQAALSFAYPLVNSSNTISLAFGTTTANAWSALQTFNGGITVTGNTTLANATTSALFSTNHLTNTFAAGQTGTTTISATGALATPSLTVGSLSGILYGNAGAVAAATVNSPLSFSSGALSISQANGSTNGYLSSADWTLFNNKISSSSLSGASVISYNGSTGVITTTPGAFAGSGAYTFPGNVGVGNPSPTQRLSVVTGASQTGLYVENQGDSTYPTAVFKNNQAGSYASIDVYGGSAITNANKFQFGQYATGDAFYYLVGNNNLDFFTNSTNRIRITGGGNVGIGDTNPGSKLSVAGDISLTGGIVDNNATRGTNGQVLQTTGTGVQWVSTSTLGFVTGVSSVFGRTGDVVAQSGDYTTAQVTESGNLYFTNARAQAAISVSGLPLTYSAGVIGINQANGSTDGYLSSTDWNTFNSKQAALTGTTGQFPYFSGTNTVTATSSLFMAANGNVGVGTTSPAAKLTVGGDINATGKVVLNGQTVAYVPGGTYSGTMFLGDGGTNISGTGLSGWYDTGVGVNALAALTTGYFNTALGGGALSAATSSGYNTALGALTLYNNTGGAYNTAVGASALNSNTTGNYNAAQGYLALSGNTTGGGNAAFGAYALQNNTTGSSNIAMGFNALANNSTGVANTAVGYQAGQGAVSSSATGNTSFGYNAGILLGNNANYNTLLGYSAGSNITTGARNIIIGYNATAPSASGSDQLNIGNTLYGNLSSGNVGIGTTSPFAKLSVAGDIAVTGGIYDANATRGTSGQVLQTTGTGVQWVSTSTLGFGTGSVTSVNASGGTTGLSFTGGPITTSGTLTLGGTLGVANGGTGSTTLSGILVGNGTSAVTTLAITAPLKLVGGTLSMPQAGSTDGYLSAADWNTFNNKQAALTGTTGQFPYFSGTNTVTATSTLFLATSGNIGIGTTSPTAKLSIVSKPSGISAAPALDYLLAPAYGTVSAGGTYFLNVASSTYAPTGTLIRAQISQQDNNTVTNLGGLTFGNTSSFSDGVAYYGTGNSVLVTGSPTINDTVGGSGLGGHYLEFTGVNSSVSVTPNVVSALAGWGFNTYGGKFNNSSAASAYSSQQGAYGVYGSATGNLTTSMGQKYGGYFTTYGTANTNYGVYADASGASTNYGVLTNVGASSTNYALYAGGGAQSYFGGNVGVGTTSPFAALSVQGSGYFAGNLQATNLTATGTVTFSGLGSGLLKSTAGVLSIATAGTDYAGTTTGSSILYGNGVGGFSNATVSSPLTFSGGALGIQQANGSQNGYLSSTDWNTFNSKQVALTGATGQFPYFSGTNTVTATSSLFMAANGYVGIGTTTPGSLLSVGGIANFDTATSTLYSTGGLNITGNCYGINGACVLATNSTSANLAVGQYTLASNTFGTYNLATGYAALYFNTIGSSNTAYGPMAMYYNSTGSYNTAIGYGSAEGSFNASNITGNVAVGYNTGNALRTGGDYNTLLGYSAGSNITTGARNIIIGYNTTASSASGSDQLNIGSTIYGNLSSKLVGVGTTTPGATFAVQGNGLFSGNLNVAGLTATGTVTFSGLGSGLVKSTSGVLGLAVSGTDYAPATSGSNILYGNGTGGFSNVTVGSGLTFSGGTLSASGGGSGTVGSGTTGQFPYYAANGTTLTATSSLFMNAAGKIGIGTTLPSYLLTVNGGTNVPTLNVTGLTSITGTTTIQTGIVSANESNTNYALGVGGNIRVGSGGFGTFAIRGYSPSANDTSGASLAILGGDGSPPDNDDGGNGGNVYLAGGKKGTGSATMSDGNVVLGYNGTSFVGNVGIGTTSPYALLSIAGSGVVTGTLTGTTLSATTTLTAPGITANATGVTLTNNLLMSGNGISNAGTISVTGQSLFATSGGSVGIGTSTPGSLLSIGNTNGINFSTATSTFNSTGGINLTNGCFAVNGVCIGAGGGGSYTFSNGLTLSGSTVTNDLSTGVAGGQSVIGGTGASDNLTLVSTSNATKGLIYFGAAHNAFYDTANQYFQVNTNGAGITQTLTSGMWLQNSTAATSGLQQISPSIVWEGQGWKTNATAASQPVRFQSYVLPVSGAAAPTANWLLQSSINGGLFTTNLTVTSAGAVTASGALSAASISTAGALSGGSVTANGVLASQNSTNANFYVFANSAASNQTVSQFTFGGRTGVGIRSGFYGSSATAITANYNYGSVVVGSAPLAEASSGNHQMIANLVVKALGTITAGAATVSDTASLYIDGAGSATVSGNNWAIYASSTAPSFFGGSITLGSAADLTLPKLAAPAGSFLAVDATGKIIATTTPTGGTSLTGTTGQFPYFSGTNTVTATSSLYIASNGNLGVGTTNPGSKLALFSNTNYGTFSTGATTEFSAASSTFTPTVTLTGTTASPTVAANGSRSELNLSNLTMGSIGSSNGNIFQGSSGLFSVTGTPTFNDTGSGTGYPNGLVVYGLKSDVSLTPTLVSDNSNAAYLESYAGYFMNTSTFGSHDTNSNGIYVETNSALDTSAGSHHAATFKAYGTASSNEGLNVDVSDADFNTGINLQVGGLGTSNTGLSISVDSASNTFGIYSTVQSGANNYNIYADGGAQSFFAGNVGIGSSTPYAQLSLMNDYFPGVPAIITGSSTATNFIVTDTGKVGIGTSSPYAALALGGGNLVLGAATAGGTAGDLYLPKLGTAAGSFLAVDANGKVIATTTPAGGGSNYFTNSGTKTYLSTGSFLGIGSTSPMALLTIDGNAGGASATTPLLVVKQQSGAATDYFDFYSASGSNVFSMSQYGNITAAGTIQGGGISAYSPSPSFTPFTVSGPYGGSQTADLATFSTGQLSTGQSIINRSAQFGIGTSSTPWMLDIATSSTGTLFKGGQLALTDTQAASGLKHIVFSNENGNFYLSSATDSYATSSLPSLTVLSTGSVGVGTTSPMGTFAVQAANGTNNAGSSINLYAGAGGVKLGAGQVGGKVGMYAGNGADGVDGAAGGDLQLFAGNGGAGTVGTGASGGGGGNIYVTPGAGGLGDTANFGFSGLAGNVLLAVTTGNTAQGRVGIGTNAPSAQLHTTGTVRFANFGAGSLQTDSSGNVTVSSDERLKDISGSFSRGLSDIQKLNPILYHWNKESGLNQQDLNAGFSAQNVQGAIPEAVGQDSRGYLTLQDRPILAASVNAIKELASRTDSLSLATTSLAAQVNTLSLAQAPLSAQLGTLSLNADTLAAQVADLQAAFASSTLPHALTATAVNADTMTIAQGFTADSVTARMATVSGTVSANRYVVPQSASTFTFGSTTITATLPQEALTDGGNVDLYKLATYAIASVQNLAQRTDLLSVKIDDLESRLAALEALNVKGADGSTLAGAGGLALSTIQDALSSIGIIVKDGMAMLDKLVTHQLVLVKGKDGTSSTGSSVIPAGSVQLIVSNPLVHTSSKIFLTFTSSVDGGWYLAQKQEGSFTITLAKPQPADVAFDYFLLQTDPDAQIAAAAAPVAPAGNGTTTPPAPVSQDGGPTVTLKGDAAVQLVQGAAWTDPGATAKAADGTDLTASIAVSGGADVNTPGTYTITYRATDAAGKYGEASRVVTVLAPTMTPVKDPAVTQAPAGSGTAGSTSTGSGSTGTGASTSGSGKTAGAGTTGGTTGAADPGTTAAAPTPTAPSGDAGTSGGTAAAPASPVTAAPDATPAS